MGKGSGHGRIVKDKFDKSPIWNTIGPTAEKNRKTEPESKGRYVKVYK